MFRLATAEDDAQLRALLAETPLPGRITISLRREPSYFAAAKVDGPQHQVTVAAERSSGRIVAMGTRSVRLRHYAGQRLPIGYLSNLRCRPEVRGGILLARGYEFLRQLDQDGAACGYLTTIGSSNQVALAALTSGRAGLPRYQWLGRYMTATVPLRPAHLLSRPVHGLDIRTATPDDVPRILELFEREGTRRAFFPVYDAAELFKPANTFQELNASDVFLAERQGRLVGTLGCWNQMAFRQTVIEGYQGWLRTCRPLYNLWAGCFGNPLLPPRGTTLQQLTATFPLAADPPDEVFDALLRAASERYRPRGFRHLLIGLGETDPLWPPVRRRSTYNYVTNVYLVSWSPHAFEHGPAEAPLYLELGCL